MTSGKPVPGANDGPVLERTASDERAASQPIRDIEEIIAKLKLVTKRLAHPVREDGEAEAAEAIASMS
jgi:hypothetical protein